MVYMLKMMNLIIKDGEIALNQSHSITCRSVDARRPAGLVGLIKQQPRHQGDGKANQYDTIDTVNKLNIMRGKPISNFTRQHYLSDICCEHHQ